MANTTIHIWHNIQGEIIAIGRPIGETKCLPVTVQDQFMMEVEIQEEHITDLHRTHIVDVHKKCLVEYSASKATGK